MKSAVLVFRGSRCALWAIALLLATSIGSASAQQSPAPAPVAPPAATQRPPVSVGGWRYQRSDPDIHVFYCEQPACGAGSKVSYRLYPPNNTMTLEQFRGGQDQVVKALEQRTPGLRITVTGVEGDKGTASPRMFKARRLAEWPSGSKEYQISSWLFGAGASATLISSAGDEKICNDNYAKFAVALMLHLAPRTR